MSKKRHLRRYMNRTPPAPKSTPHNSNEYLLREWERWLSLIEQTKDPMTAEIDRQTRAVATGKQDGIEWNTHVKPADPKFSDSFARQMTVSGFYQILDDVAQALDVQPDDVHGEWHEQTPQTLAPNVQKLLTALSQKLQPENPAPPKPMQMPQMPQMPQMDGWPPLLQQKPQEQQPPQKVEKKKSEKKDEQGKEPAEGEEGQEGEPDGPPEATYQKKKYKKSKDASNEDGEDGEEGEEGDEGEGEDEDDYDDGDEDGDKSSDSSSSDNDDFERPPGAAAGGGGQTRKEALAEQSFWAARQAIVNLCVAPDPLDKPEEGTDVYNLKRVAKSAYNPATLNNIRDQLGQTVDNVYLILDTSGSVSEYANKIATIAAAAAGIVHIFSGTEARPEYKVERATPLGSAHDQFPEWRHPKSMSGATAAEAKESDDFQKRFTEESGAGAAARTKGERIGTPFESEVAWFLKKERPPKGSHIIFWTDTYGCGIIQGLVLKSLLSDYHVTLMIPQTREELEQNDHITPQKMQKLIDKGLEPFASQGWFEAHIFVAAGAKIFYGIKNGRQFADALKKL